MARPSSRKAVREDAHGSAVRSILRVVDPKRYIRYLEASRTLPKTEEDLKAAFLARKNQANLDAFEQLVQLNSERMVWARQVQRELDQTFIRLQWMTMTTFVMGIGLIVVPLTLYYASPTHDTNLLWFGGFGLAETLTALLYRPMGRMQEAVSDLAQSIMILNSWVTQVGLVLYKMDSEKGNEVNDATERIGKVTLEHVKWIQRFTEEPRPPEESRPKQH